MKKKNGFISLGFIFLIVTTFFLVSYYSGSKKVKYFWRTSEIEKGDVSLIITATGVISADTTVSVGTQVSGILSKLYVDYNSTVRKGQIVAQIDTTVMHATKEDAEASVEKARAQLNQYEREYVRQKKLFDSGTISLLDFELTTTNYEAAKATHKSMIAQLDRAIINLHYATIKSPINGIVISKNIDEGQTVIANFNTPTLFTVINNLKKMQVQANVSEADIGEVKKGQEVDFTVDAFPDEIFTGHVQQVRIQPVAVQNVVNYIVIIDAINSELKLMPGFTASINIKIKHQPDVFKVSANALSFIPPKEYFSSNTILPDSVNKLWLKKIETDSKNSIIKQENITYLWIKYGDDVFPLAVKKGLSDGIFTEVIGNVKEGQEVVTGINISAPAKETAKQNPFLPKFPTRNRRT